MSAVKIKDFENVFRSILEEQYAFFEENEIDADGDAESAYNEPYIVEEILDPLTDGAEDPTYFFKDIVEQRGGEGEGDDIWYVFRVVHPVHGEFLVRYDGTWVSWDGAYWDDTEPYQVAPVQVLVTEYQAVK